MTYHALLAAVDQSTAAARDQLHRLLLEALQGTVSRKDYARHTELVELELALVDVMARHGDPYGIALRVVDASL